MAELNLADETRGAQVAWSPANHAIGTNWEGGGGVIANFKR
jgi:hypothetical protein